MNGKDHSVSPSMHAHPEARAYNFINDSLNTKDMLQRIHWNVTYNYGCLLCAGGHHENMDHLFSHAILVTEWEHGDVLFQIEEVLDNPSCCGVFLACWNI
jgi:hypothetical protein